MCGNKSMFWTKGEKIGNNFFIERRTDDIAICKFKEGKELQQYEL